VQNILYFSFFRILPSEIRRVFYLGGRGYYAANIGILGQNVYFTRAYRALTKLNDEVNFIQDGNCLNLIVNNTTHEPVKSKYLKTINLSFVIPLAQKYCRDEYTAEHFYVNYLTHEKLAEFFALLKANDCYDNSRIIIVSDHGRFDIKTTTMSFLRDFEQTPFEPERFIPLMMVKDFYSDGALKKDDVFMTLADIPLLVTEGLPPELQINPFSGKFFKETQDKTVVKIINSVAWNAAQQKNLTQFVKTQDLWAYVHDDVYNPNNWSWTRTKKE